MELRASFAFLLGLFLSMVLIPPLVRIAAPLGLMDTGGGRNVHAGSIPRIGGIAIFVGFLLPVLLWAPIDSRLGVFVAAVAVLFVFGLLDDRFNLDYRLKLFGQLLAAGIVTISADVLIQRLEFWPGGVLPYGVALPLSWLVFAGLTNAVNLSDGLDGLAGGIGLLAVCGLLVISVESGAGVLLIVLAALLGAILGFLRFNTYPARLFMGDAGSQLLGFSTGVLAVLITQRPDANLSPVLPLLVLGLPILDMLTVMVGRMMRGRSPFQADRNHLHHRLIDAGLTQSEAVSLIYGLQFLLILLAYLLRHAEDALVLLVALLVGVLILFGLRSFERRRLEKSDRRLRLPLLELMSDWPRHKASSRLPFQALSIALPVFLVFGALTVSAVGRDIGVLAAALLGGLLLVLLIRPLPVFALERLSTYTLSLTIIYLLAGSPVAVVCPACLMTYYAVLAVAAATWVWQSSGEGFQVSSLDVLILIAALVAPGLRGLGLADYGLMAMEAAILFYSIEILMSSPGRYWYWLRTATLVGLAVLAVRGLLSL